MMRWQVGGKKKEKKEKKIQVKKDEEKDEKRMWGNKGREIRKQIIKGQRKENRGKECKRRFQN